MSRASNIFPDYSPRSKASFEVEKPTTGPGSRFGHERGGLRFKSERLGLHFQEHNFVSFVDGINGLLNIPEIVEGRDIIGDQEVQKDIGASWELSLRRFLLVFRGEFIINLYAEDILWLTGIEVSLSFGAWYAEVWQWTRLRSRPYLTLAAPLNRGKYFRRPC